MRKEQEPGISKPATEQTPEEISLAHELQGMIHELLGDNDSISFDFGGRGEFDVSTERHSRLPSVRGTLLSSPEWPDPIYSPLYSVSAQIRRSAEVCSIKVIDSGNYGVRFTLYDTYPRVDIIIPESDPRSTTGERRPWKETSIPARDGRLRPRIERLKYGKFLLTRIKAANSGAEVLP